MKFLKRRKKSFMKKETMEINKKNDENNNHNTHKYATIVNNLKIKC